MALVGTLLTLVLPEPSRRSLEDISDEGRGRGEVQRLVPVEVQAAGGLSGAGQRSAAYVTRPLDV